MLSVVKREFPNEDAQAIVALLDAYGVESYENERDRVQLAILKLSQGEAEKLLEVIYILLESSRHISLMILPFMPETSDKILLTLGLNPSDEKGKSIKDLRKWAELPAGGIIKKGESLFPRI